MQSDQDNTQLWAVHLLPHDEHHAAPTKEEADAACVLINAAASRQAEPGMPPPITATACPWPYSAASYTGTVSDFYTPFLR